MKRMLFIVALLPFLVKAQSINNQKVRWMQPIYMGSNTVSSANSSSDTGFFFFDRSDSLLYFKYKGSSRAIAYTSTVPTIDSFSYSTRAWRQKGDDSVSALISPRITDSLRSLVRLRASGSGGIQLQNSNGTNVADFGTANTTNGSIAGGWNVGGNLSITGTSGFTGKATFTDSIVGVNQRLSGNIQASTFNGSVLPTVSGTSNFIPKFTATSTLGNSLIQEFSGARVGINAIDNGADVLQVNGSGIFNAQRIIVDGGSVFANSGLRISGAGTGTNKNQWYVGSSQDGNILTNGGFFVRNESSGTNPFFILNSGAASFSSTLSVSGALTATAQGNNITIGVDSSVTTTTYTLVLGDAGYLKRCDNASAITITVPTNASVAFPIGTQIFFSQKAAGKVTLSPASGVNLRSEGNLLGTAGQHAVIGILKVNTNDWLVIGNRG